MKGIECKNCFAIGNERKILGKEKRRKRSKITNFPANISWNFDEKKRYFNENEF